MKLYAYVRCTELLSAYSAKEIYVAAFVLPSWNVLERGNDRIHKRETESNMVTGTDCRSKSTGASSLMENYIPVDIRKVFGERAPESVTEERENTGRKRNKGKIQYGQVYSEAGQKCLQQKNSGTLGSGYGGERARKKQGVLCYTGGTEDTVLHSGEDTGSESGHHGKCDCGNVISFSE